MVREAKLKLGINNLLHGFYFALGIVRVQYPILYGYRSEASPCKARPNPDFFIGIGERPNQLEVKTFSFSLSALSLRLKNDTTLKILIS